MPKYLRGERVRIIASGYLGEIQLESGPGRPFYILTVDANPDGSRLRTVATYECDEREIEPVDSGVNVVRYGLSPEQLGSGFTDFIRRAYRRIVTVGRVYSNGPSQQFEDMPIRNLAEMALEELEDLAVYAGMLHIRFQRLIAAMDAANTKGDAL